MNLQPEPQSFYKPVNLKVNICFTSSQIQHSANTMKLLHEHKTLLHSCIQRQIYEQLNAKRHNDPQAYQQLELEHSVDQINLN